MRKVSATGSLPGKSSSAGCILILYPGLLPSRIDTNGTTRAWLDRAMDEVAVLVSAGSQKNGTSSLLLPQLHWSGAYHTGLLS